MSAVTTTPAVAGPLRARGIGPVRASLLLAQWQLRRQAEFMPLMIIVQIFLAVTTVIGYGLLVGDPDPATALYLATGAPTITLVTVGLVMTPQMVAMARTEGSLDWMRTLPVPRWAFLVADLTVWTIIALPGMVLGIITGVLKFHVHLSLAPWLVPGAIAVSLVSAAVGYAMASLLKPQVAQLMTQALIFIVLLFSPVSYPRERMPLWLQHAHDWLPIEPMAQLIRSGLAHDVFPMPARSVVVLTVWGVAAVAAAAAALRKRA